MDKEVLLISPNAVKADTLVNYNVNDEDIAYSIKIAQNVYLREIIGSNLLNALKTLIYNKIQGETPDIDADGYEKYKELLDDYVSVWLGYKAQQEIVKSITFKIRNIGVSKDNDTNIQSITMQDANSLYKHFDVLVNDMSNRLSEYLCENKSSFPELDCKCANNANRVGDKFASTDLWLGGNNNGCKCKC